MSTAVFVLVLLAAVPHLILGGAGIDRLIVQIPAWYRIGPVAFARYARAADLGNGLFRYPLLGISGPSSPADRLRIGALDQHPDRRLQELVPFLALEAHPAVEGPQHGDQEQALEAHHGRPHVDLGTELRRCLVEGALKDLDGLSGA